MATLEEIGLALKEADAAGNEEDARKLAGFYREMQAQEAQNEELPSRTAADIVKDVGVTAGRTGVSALQGIEGLADLAPGVNATKYLTEHGVDLDKVNQYLQESASPQQQRAYKNLTEAKGAGNILSAAVENPSAVAELAGESILPMLTGAGIASKAVKYAPALAKYAPNIGEALMQAGQEAHKLTAEAPDKELSGKGEAAAIGSGVLDAVLGRVAGKLVSKAGGSNIEDTLYGTIAKDLGTDAARNPSVVKRILASTLGEGAEEALQGGQERIWDNYAKGATNLPTLLEGAVDDATLGAILGSVMGTGASVIPSKGEQPQAEETSAEVAKAPEAQAPKPEVSEQERRVDIENGLERAGVDPEEHPELYAELSKPEHYQSEESINALDERLQRYKSEPPKEGETEEGINFAKALPAEFDDTAWEEHLNKQREYARQGQSAQAEVKESVQPKEAEVLAPEITAPESMQTQEEAVQSQPTAEEQEVTQPEPTETEPEKPSVSTSDITTGYTAESLQPHLTPEMKKLVESGKLTLHDTANTLPGEDHPENVQGLTTPQGEVHLVADKLTPETLPKVAMHEMGVHVGMRGMVGDKVWNDLTSQALTTKGKAFEAARSAVPENTPDHLKGEETLAYLVENAPHLPIVKRIISAVKNWARTTFGAKLSLTESDVHHLAAKALRRESKTSARTQREGSAFSYIGQKGVGADTSALSRATKLAQEGVDNETIRKDTGWFLGHDNKWRFEVGDTNAAFNQDFSNIPEKTTFKLGEVFSSPEVFSKYPDAANIEFEVKSPMFDWSKSSQGWFDDTRNKIVVTPYAENPTSTITHELQHWIQNKEGFAPGGNYSSIREYDEKLLSALEKYIKAEKYEFIKELGMEDISKVRESLTDIKTAHAKLHNLEGIDRKLDALKNKIKSKMESIKSKTRNEYETKSKAIKDIRAKNYENIDKLREEYYALGYNHPDRVTLQAQIDKLDAENSELFKESLKFMNPTSAIREAVSKYESQLDKLKTLKRKSEDEVRDVSRKLDRLIPDRIKHKAYELISGEVEARDVEARREFTLEQRREVTPYTSQGISKEDVIVLPNSNANGSRYSIAQNPKLQEQVEKDRQNMRPAPAQKPKKTVKEKLSRTGENLQRAADVIETQFFSHDAAFINSLRRSLGGSGRDAATIGKIMDRSSQAQAVSESSMAAEATLRGGMEYDPTTEFFVSVDKPDNVVNERQLIDDAGAKYGWSEAEVNKFYTTYLVSGRLKEKYEKARALKAAANAEKDPIAKSKLFRESREIMDTLKLEMTEEECNKAREAYKSVDEFVQAEKMWHKIRQNTIDVLVKSGLYSNEKAEAYMDAAFYTPMWRVMTEETKPEELESIFDDMANGKFKTNISSLTKGMREQKFKGSKREVFNMLDNHEHWVQISMSRAIRAKKATDMIDAARRYLPEGSVSRVYGTKSNKDGTVTCYFHGKKQYWKFEDPLMAAAFNGVPAAPFVLRSAAKISSVLRDGIVLTPTFTLSQLPQDIYDAAFTSGIKNPVKLFTTMLSEFKTTAFSKEDTEAHKALRAIGAVGIKDTIGDTRSLHAYDTLHHTHLSKDKTAWRKFVNSLEKFAMAGDNAIRQAVYVRTMEELKDDPRAKSIAYQRAFDIINFRRRGASAKLETIRSVTPFLGATMQAYRATLQVAAGRGLAYQSSADDLSVRKRLASTSGIMIIMSLIYNALYGGLLGSDEDKDKFNTRDIHYKDTHIMMFGANSMLSIPVRPSIFSLPYITGNHLYQSFAAKSENPRQVYDAYREAILTAFGAPLLPPVIREPIQQAANYDFFTGRPIVPERLRKNEPAYQYDAHTSAFGKLVGQASSNLPPEMQLSPIKVDHFMKGWFSGVATAILGAFNIAEHFASSNPTKEHTMREMVRMFPSVSGLVPAEEEPQSKATYYDLREDVERVHSTYNRLVREGDREGARKYRENNKALLNESLHQKMNHLKTETDKIHTDTRKILGNARLSSEIKAERVKRLEAKERRLLSRVQNLYNRAYH